MLGIYEYEKRVNNTKRDSADYQLSGSPDVLSLEEDRIKNNLPLRRALWARALNPTGFARFPDIIDSISSTLFSAPETTRIFPVKMVPAVAFLLLGDYPRGGNGEPFFRTGEVATVNASARTALARALRRIDQRANGRTLWIIPVLLRHDQLDFNCIDSAATAAEQMKCPDFYDRFAAFEATLK